MAQTFQISISGQVQGVGFRPFVYGLAQQFQYSGAVCNNENGVLIYLNTSLENATTFFKKIVANAPKIAIIKSHSIKEIAHRDYDGFTIIPSKAENQINTPLTPDFAICNSCKTEIRDAKNRRYGYAFTTCTGCGPRFSVTTKFPFERAHTTLKDFDMCPSCKAEYNDPSDKRFHSQTNSCAVCGITLKLITARGKEILSTQSEIVKKVAEFIVKGNIVALKNTNGYLLCCAANNKATIDRLREKKQRPAKPFALLYPSVEKIETDFKLNAAEKTALTSFVAPIVIIEPKAEIAGLELQSIAPGLDKLGVMLPSTSLLTLLMDQLKVPIIATSGNIHGSPIISKETEAVEKLSQVADYFLHHNLEVSFPQDDSVVRFAGNHKITLRRSRGLAPNYLGLNLSEDVKIVAMGAQLKSTFTFIPNSHGYVSPIYGNLDSYAVARRYQEDIAHYQKLFGTAPQIVLIDPHPHYQSNIIGRELASKWKAKLVSIQHHKAHFASVLLEHRLFQSKEKILGVVWDGTGLGDDNAIWGGEFFNYQNQKMQRLTHFDYVDWIAADRMAEQPRLSLLSMLPSAERAQVKSKFSVTEWKIYTKMLEGKNLKTSSVGRLFDAVASLLDIIDSTTYEGEAAMLLENKAGTYKEDGFIDFLDNVEYKTIPTETIIKNINKAKTEGIAIARIANSFIHTLALIILKIAKYNNYGIIACSGGVFQNTLLVQKLAYLSEKQGIKLKFNRILSSNDENVSFGQLGYYQQIKN